MVIMSQGANALLQAVLAVNHVEQILAELLVEPAPESISERH